MILIDGPYVSQLLIDRIVERQYEVVDTPIARSFTKDANVNYISESDAVMKYKNNPEEMIYTNSENAIQWVVDNLGFSKLPGWINLFKDKYAFREMTSGMYPDLFYKKFAVNELDSIDIDSLPIPFVIKPSVGFFSLGVYKVIRKDEWPNVLSSIKSELDHIKTLYPEAVLNISDFIVEGIIEGDEYAFDAYINKEGKAVLLNVLEHVFDGESDVSDRVYKCSSIMYREMKEDILAFLQKIADLSGVRSFPMHVEVRIDKTGKIIPIEVNPLRTGGWCSTADMTWFAYGYAPYEHILDQTEPDWDKVFKEKDAYIYTNIVLDNSTGYKGEEIKSFDYDALGKHFRKVLEMRPTDYKRFPVLGFLFTETLVNDQKELDWVLQSDLKEFVSL
jgi:hypothetical protein